MGYDILPGGQQVKCWWSDMRGIEDGDDVVEIDGNDTYSVALREGGFAHVTEGKFSGVHARPLSEGPVFDKWGDPFYEGYKGIFGEGYLFEKIVQKGK